MGLPFAKKIYLSSVRVIVVIWTRVTVRVIVVIWTRVTTRVISQGDRYETGFQGDRYGMKPDFRDIDMA